MQAVALYLKFDLQLEASREILGRLAYDPTAA